MLNLIRLPWHCRWVAPLMTTPISYTLWGAAGNNTSSRQPKGSRIHTTKNSWFDLNSFLTERKCFPRTLHLPFGFISALCPGLIRIHLHRPVQVFCMPSPQFPVTTQPVVCSRGSVFLPSYLCSHTRRDTSLEVSVLVLSFFLS